MDGFVETAVPAAVEAVSHDSSAAGLYGRCAVSCGIAGFGGEPGGIAGVSQYLCCYQRAHAVDVSQGRAGGNHRFCDLNAESVDLAVQPADASDAPSRDTRLGCGVTAQHPGCGVEAFGRGERSGVVVVSEAYLLKGAVQTADGACALLHEFTTVGHQAHQIIGHANPLGRRQVIVTRGYPGDLQRVYSACFAVGPPTASGCRCHLRGQLPPP